MAAPDATIWPLATDVHDNMAQPSVRNTVVSPRKQTAAPTSNKTP